MIFASSSLCKTRLPPSLRQRQQQQQQQYQPRKMASVTAYIEEKDLAAKVRLLFLGKEKERDKSTTADKRQPRKEKTLPLLCASCV